YEPLKTNADNCLPHEVSTMTSLFASLDNSDLAVLNVIATYWGIDVTLVEPDKMARVMSEAMLTDDRAAAAWDRLTDEQRGALQTLIGSNNKMPLLMFERLHGEIRKMGRGQIERQDPLNNPTSSAEALFYRGLIYEGFEQSPAGARAIVYVPSDLVNVLPTHKTSYDDLPDLPQSPQILDDIQILPIEDEDLLGEIHYADTSIVDDMVTLLAYFQIYSGDVVDGALAAEDFTAIQAHLINDDPARLTFLFEVGISAELFEVVDSIVRPRRAETKRWLESTRSQQLKALADAWKESTIYRDLWHVSGLRPEPGGWGYHPTAGRIAICKFLSEHVPQQHWWDIDDFIMAIKHIEPDFQRNHYESWYIRNDRGEYLNGFESWDAVEGALLEFYLMCPLHWLGMVDLGENAAHLNAYGRAFVNGQPFPQPPEEPEPITVNPDGTLLISRRVSRMDRFQAMRFTTWVSAATNMSPYVYKLSQAGIRQAAEQGINLGHIQAFLKRVMEVEELPATLNRLLQNWQSAPQAQVTIEPMIVLRATSPETLDFIMSTPNLRRFCGSRLGPMAVAVLQDQWRGLQDALAEHGIEVTVMGTL
ncbi:MAG: hypothetical protein CUN56_02880, partial [Phototrophicales bacterium]